MMIAGALSLFLILVLLAVIVIGIGLTVRSSTRRTPYRPQRRPFPLRIACAVIGVGILAALWIATARVSRLAYQPAIPQSPQPQVQAPTHPPPTMPPESGHQRYLFTAVVLDRLTGPTFNTPLWAESFTMDWPAKPESSSVGKQWNTRDLQLRLVVRLTPTSTGEPSGDVRTEVKQRHYQSSSTSGFNLNSKPEDCAIATDLPGKERKYWLAVGTARPADDRKLLLFVNRLAPDDPLQSGSWDAFAGTHRAILQAAPEAPPIRTSPFTREKNQTPPAIRLAMSMGLPLLAALLAAAALGQLFVYRTWAKTGLALGSVLFLVQLDRMALATHLAHLRDRQAPPRIRQVAAFNARQTFFFQQTAGQALNFIGEDSAEPIELRKYILGPNDFDFLNAWRETPANRPLHRMTLRVRDEDSAPAATQPTPRLPGDGPNPPDCLKFAYCRCGSLHFNNTLPVQQTATLSLGYYSRTVAPVEEPRGLQSTPHLTRPERWFTRSFRPQKGSTWVMCFRDVNSAPASAGVDVTRLPLRFVWFRVNTILGQLVEIEWRMLDADGKPIAVAPSADNPPEATTGCSAAHTDW